jgi:hypothetical protein
MNLWFKRAIGAAGIAVGFLLWQGSPAGASELVEHPLASAAKSGNAVGVAALGDTAGRVTSGNLGEVETSIGVQATTGRSEHSGSSGSAVTSSKSSVTFEGSEVRIAHAEGGRLGEVQQHLVAESAGDDADARLGARARLSRAKLQQPEPTINRAQGMVKRLVTKATKLSARGRGDAPEATRALELTIGVKVSGHARLWTCKRVDLRAKARTEVHPGQVGLVAIA